jgi:hypothetical protein
VRAAALVLLVAASAFADEDPGTAFEAERDLLLAKIARGENLAASVERFASLAQKRKDLIAAKEKAVVDARAAEEKRQADRAAIEKWRSAYTSTLDYAASISCRFAVDPTNAPKVPYSDRGLADWAKVVRKESLDLPRVGVLNGEPATLYEIEGRAGRYHVEVARSSDFREFSAERGDLVLVCQHDTQHDRRAPAEWNPFVRGMVAKIARPPKITQKMRWNPAHLSHEDVRRAIYSQKWPLPPGQKALMAFVTDEDLGNGRWRAGFFSGGEWTIVVPPSLRARVVAGHQVWAIVGDPIWEGKEKLVLPVEDLEERYVD